MTGTYGTVFKAKNRETHEIVALKRVRLDDDDEVRGLLRQKFKIDFIETCNISMLIRMFLHRGCPVQLSEKSVF